MGKRSRKVNQQQRYRQSQPEILAALSERVGLLVDACALFDGQQFVQAKRIALDLRILLHDSRTSTSLLAQLDVKDAMWFEDSCGPIHPRQIGGIGNLAAASSSSAWRDDWVPLYEKRPLRGPLPPAPFKAWWKEAVLRDNDGRRFSRSDLVLGVSNQDGGAHVDPELDESYARLSRMNSVGLELASSPNGPWRAAGSPVPASMRQIAHEVVRSCQWWLGAALTATARVSEEQAAAALAPLDTYVGLNEEELAGRDPAQLEQAPST